MKQITCVKKDQIRYFLGDHDEEISHVHWIDQDTREQDLWTRERMYEYLRDGGRAYTSVGGRSVWVEHAINRVGTRFVRTIADGYLNNNLGQLPICTH